MNKYRPAAVALAACSASLSLAACSAGITTASTATTAATSSSSGTAASASAPAGRLLSVSGAVHSFPIPAGAKVAQNIGAGGEIIVIFSMVTPAKSK